MTQTRREMLIIKREDINIERTLLINLSIGNGSYGYSCVDIYTTHHHSPNMTLACMYFSGQYLYYLGKDNTT